MIVSESSVRIGQSGPDFEWCGRGLGPGAARESGRGSGLTRGRLGVLGGLQPTRACPGHPQAGGWGSWLAGGGPQSSLPVVGGSRGGGARVRQVALAVTWGGGGRGKLCLAVALVGGQSTVGASLLWPRGHLRGGGGPQPGEAPHPGQGETVPRLCQSARHIAGCSSGSRRRTPAGGGTSPLLQVAPPYPHTGPRGAAGSLQT